MNLPESSFFLKTRSVPSADLIITLSFDLIIVLFIRLFSFNRLTKTSSVISSTTFPKLSITGVKSSV